MKNSFLEPYFPTVFLSDYIREESFGLTRLQIYSLFRFFTSVSEDSKSVAVFLRQMSDASLSEDSWDTLAAYLAEDFYFSPAIRFGSFDAVLLYYAIWIAKNSDAERDRILYACFSHYCPAILRCDPSSSSVIFPDEDYTASYFYGCLVRISCDAPARLSSLFSQFADAYREDLHFTCEDFVVYDFMDTYFEIHNCRNHPKFQELIHTLAIATLKAQDLTLEECVHTECMKKLTRPASQFAGIMRYGALTIPESDLEPEDVLTKRLEHLLDYAVTTELRQNLFDFHLDDDRLITLDNWKEQLKWYHVQYDRAYADALASFYTATLSRAFVRHQFLDNLRSL